MPTALRSPNVSSCLQAPFHLGSDQPTFTVHCVPPEGPRTHSRLGHSLHPWEVHNSVLISVVMRMPNVDRRPVNPGRGWESGKDTERVSPSSGSLADKGGLSVYLSKWAWSRVPFNTLWCWQILDFSMSSTLQPAHRSSHSNFSWNSKNLCLSSWSLRNV